MKRWSPHIAFGVLAVVVLAGLIMTRYRDLNIFQGSVTESDVSGYEFTHGDLPHGTFVVRPAESSRLRRGIFTCPTDAPPEGYTWLTPQGIHDGTYRVYEFTQALSEKDTSLPESARWTGNRYGYDDFPNTLSVLAPGRTYYVETDLDEQLAFRCTFPAVHGEGWLAGSPFMAFIEFSAPVEAGSLTFVESNVTIDNVQIDDGMAVVTVDVTSANQAQEISEAGFYVAFRNVEHEVTGELLPHVYAHVLPGFSPQPVSSTSAGTSASSVDSASSTSVPPPSSSSASSASSYSFSVSSHDPQACTVSTDCPDRPCAYERCANNTCHYITQIECGPTICQNDSDCPDVACQESKSCATYTCAYTYIPGCTPSSASSTSTSQGSSQSSSTSSTSSSGGNNGGTDGGTSGGTTGGDTGGSSGGTSSSSSSGGTCGNGICEAADNGTDPCCADYCGGDCGSTCQPIPGCTNPPPENCPKICPNGCLPVGQTNAWPCGGLICPDSCGSSSQGGGAAGGVNGGNTGGSSSSSGGGNNGGNVGGNSGGTGADDGGATGTTGGASGGTPGGTTGGSTGGSSASTQSSAQSSAAGTTGGDGGISETASCPFIYSWNGERYVLEHEATPLSILATLEDTSHQALAALKEENGVVKLRVAEERDETAFIDRLSVVAVDVKDEDVRVLPSITGSFHTVRDPQAPMACDIEGSSCLGATSAMDGDTADFVPPAAASSEADLTEHAMTLTFAVPEGSMQAKLVINAEKHPIMQTMLKKTKETFGNDGYLWGDALASLPLVDAMVRETFETNDLYLRVEVLHNGAWTDAGLIKTGDYRNWDDFLVVAPVTRGEEELTVRLSSRAWYMIDAVQADFSEDDDMKVTGVHMASAVRDGLDVSPLLRSQNGRRLEMTHGDTVDITFDAPGNVSEYSRTYVVSVTGYYLPHAPDGLESSLVLRTLKMTSHLLDRSDGIMSLFAEFL